MILSSNIIHQSTIHHQTKIDSHLTTPHVLLSVRIICLLLPGLTLNTNNCRWSKGRVKSESLNENVKSAAVSRLTCSASSFPERQDEGEPRHTALERSTLSRTKMSQDSVAASTTVSHIYGHPGLRYYKQRVSTRLV